MRNGNETDAMSMRDQTGRRRWVTELQPLEFLAFAGALLFVAWRIFGG